MAGTRMSDTRERAAFEADMSAHVAQLMGFSKPYTGRLPRRELELFLELALEAAWERRSEFDPHRAALLEWWDGCLRTAANSRKSWSQVYSHAVKLIRGTDLGREE